MDFRIINPTFGYSEHIDEKARRWAGTEADILDYLCDVSNLERFADMAADTDQIASYIDPFLANAEKYFEGMEKISDGQARFLVDCGIEEFSLSDQLALAVLADSSYWKDAKRQMDETDNLS